MAKGVKKIEYIKGTHYPDMSVYGTRITIKPGEEIIFGVAEWLSGTTAEDKKNAITWIRQSCDRRTIVGKVVSKTGYKFQISKKLSGSCHYYIEASLSGDRDFKNNTGLYVKGWCKPNIISSKWTTQPGSDYNIKNKNKADCISYGHIVYLHLETEGLNGNKLIVEVWNQQYAKDDKLVFVYTDVQVIDGEVNLKIQNTYAWMAHVKNIQNVEEFYIKVKDQESNQYIKDSWGDNLHAIYLNVKNKVVTVHTDVPRNQTPTKVGQPDTNKKNSHLCKFEQISIDDNSENFLVFKEGNTLLKKVTSETQFATFRVHFDFDKSYIRSDAKETLKYLLDFLLYNQHLEMMLSGHADDRGTLDYNQSLSERRAQAVGDFFTNGGLDKNRIKIRGFGEVNPAVAGKTEQAYKKNRRVEIDFSYLEYNQDAIVYETVAGNSEKLRNITVNILNRSDKACFRKEKHKKTEVIVNNMGASKENKQGSNISYPILSRQEAFPKNYAFLLGRFLNPFATIYYPFGFHINSCAYYANRSRATLEVRTYPDVVWIGHFQYNYKEAGTYFFHSKDFNDLTIGITDVLDELRNSIFWEILKILPGNFIFIFEQTLLKYIEDQANDYTYGIHTIHNRTLEKKGADLSLEGTQTNLITQTEYTKYAAASVIYGFVVVGILIDLLMIYLTRGKNLQGRIAKIARKVKAVKTVLDKMSDAGVEIMPPSIAVNAGMYYQKQKDERLALIYEVNLKANPLVAVNFKRDFDLLQIMDKAIDIKNKRTPKDKETQEKIKQNKENNSKIKEYFDNLGISVKGSVEVEGEFICEHNVKCNVLTNTYSITDKLGNGILTSENEVLLKPQITFTAKVNGQFKHMFDFDPFQNKIDAKVNVELKGAAGIKLKYGHNPNEGVFVAQTLYFSGVQGVYSGSFKNDSWFDILDIDEEIKPTPFTLIEPFEVDLFKIQLFKP